MTMIRYISPVLTLLFGLTALLSTAVQSNANPNAAAKKEIEYLLKFIARSNVDFLRNGDSHHAEEAAGHIRKKYDYYLKKISTAEDFIRLSATKSALSGKTYYVALMDGSKKSNSEWLLEELANYREKVKTSDYRVVQMP